jgi:hypothetical protein
VLSVLDHTNHRNRRFGLITLPGGDKNIFVREAIMI